MSMAGRIFSPKRLLLLMLLGSTAGPVSGEAYQPINYFGISYLQLRGSQTAGPDYSPNGIIARLGFMTGDYFGLELQAGLSQTGRNFELNSVTAAYLYAGLPYERLHLFTLAGMARTDVDSAGKSEISENFSFGFGIRWEAATNLDIGLEWMNYAERSAYQVNALNIGFVKHF